MIDSGASHCFISPELAAQCKLPIDSTSRLAVKLANGAVRPCSGVIRAVDITFSPGVCHSVDLWVVPLSHDVLLGAPWLHHTQPAIDWGCHRLIWIEDGLIVTVYGRGGYPPPPTRPAVQIVGANRFARDLRRDCLEGFVALITAVEVPPTSMGVSNALGAQEGLANIDPA